MSKILGTSNLEYHANLTHLSSSGLKALLKDPALFHKEYILQQRERSDASHFAEGSLVHTLILEPEKYVEGYAIYPGIRKQGAAFDSFKEANSGRTILSMPQLLRCERLVKAYEAMNVANSLIKEGISEHNMVSQILGVDVKARADYIVPHKNYIVDVKTTSMPSDIDLFKQTVEQYSYHLSAALYCQIAHDTYGELFDFYWLVLSKKDLQCHVYKASSDTLSRGAAMVTQAIVKYKKCLKSGLWVDNVPDVSYDSKNYEIEEV